MSIGERIGELRKSAGLSQGQLADLLGVTRQAVSKWENDLSSPDTIKLIKLSDVLDTEVEYLATGKMADKEPAPIVVNLVQNPETGPERIVEKVYERPVVKTVVKRVVRTKYKRNPFEYFAVSLIFFIIGLAAGIFLG